MSIEYLATAMREAGTKPEMEIFDVSMINNALRLVKQDLASEPLHFNFAGAARRSTGYGQNPSPLDGVDTDQRYLDCLGDRPSSIACGYVGPGHGRCGQMQP